MYRVNYALESHRSRDRVANQEILLNPFPIFSMYHLSDPDVFNRVDELTKTGFTLRASLDAGSLPYLNAPTPEVVNEAFEEAGFR